MAPRGWLLAASLFACAAVAEAQTGLPPQPFEAARSNGAFAATFVSADATRLIVQADDGSTVTFVVDGSSSVPPGLVPGSRVTVRYEQGEGSRYRVASVGIPKIPLEGGATTDPPPSPEAEPGVAAEASLAPAASPDDAGAAEPEEAPDEDEGAGDAAPPASPSATPSPSTEARASLPPNAASAASDAAQAGPSPGREAVVIGGGLLLVAAALGLLLYLRR